MSTLEVNNIKDTGSNSLISSDGSGTFTINNGVLKNTPAFFVYKSNGTNQTISSNTYTKVQFDAEVLDTDSNYASDTFTPTTAGKYFIYGNVALDASSSNFESGFVAIYKNGSLLYESQNQQTANNANHINIPISVVVDANGSTDYFEFFAKCTDSSGSPVINNGAGNRRCHFGAYRIIGA